MGLRNKEIRSAQLMDTLQQQQWKEKSTYAVGTNPSDFRAQHDVIVNGVEYMHCLHALGNDGWLWTSFYIVHQKSLIMFWGKIHLWCRTPVYILFTADHFNGKNLNP